MKIIKNAVYLGVLAILFVITVVFGFQSLRNIKNKVLESKNIKNVLSQKLSILQSVEKTLPGDMTFIDIALPNQNSAIYGLNQVKNQSAIYGLTLKSVTAGKTIDEDKIKKIPLTFEIEGGKESIFQFLKSIAQSLPLIVIEKVEIDAKKDPVYAQVTLNLYSSDNPTTIPAINSAVGELTNEEIKLLSEITSYKMPEFSEPTPSQESGKEDPFN